MPAWAILPIALPAFSITGMWIVYCKFRNACKSFCFVFLCLNVCCRQYQQGSFRTTFLSSILICLLGYAMALSNNHICPVHNWIYNQSCELDSPIFCCTLDHIPLVSKCGTFPPESCFFSLICSLGSFMVMLVGLLRYAHVIEHYGSSLLNTLGLALGWICAAGLIMVGNFQVDHAKVLHYIGAGVAFPTSMLFIFLQSILTYRMAKSRGHYWTGHLRSILAALAFITLIFSGVFFIQQSFVLQHLAALCEWMFIINVLVFYGTFTAEFGAISTDTFLVLLKARRTPKSFKVDSSTPSMSHVHTHLENMAMMGRDG